MDPARFPDGTERRGGVEIRAAGRRLEGYAVVFGVEARIGGVRETVRPGAFLASLSAAGKDVLALVDHDPGKLLARTGSGTLRLAEDSRGLAFDLDVADTQLGRDILVMAERRDLGGMSFSFHAKDEAWPAPDRRELRAVDLLEISVVLSFPAYAGTTVSARSLGLATAGQARLRRLMAGVI